MDPRNVVKEERLFINKILFIFNGATKGNGKIGVSGGDIRLFEIIKNTRNFESNVLTTINGDELMKEMKVSCEKKYIINHKVDGSARSNFLVTIKSFFCLPKGLKAYKGIVYSSCEHLYDVLPAFKISLLNKCEWYAVYHWVEDFPWKEKRGGTPIISRYLYWVQRFISGILIKRFAHKILAVSDQTREKLIKIKKIAPSKVKAVYCGVDYDRISSLLCKYKDEKESGYEAVYMKRLNYGKGIFDLLEIWNKVCCLKKEAKLAIIGEGSKEIIAKIKDFIGKNNLRGNIFLLGVVLDIEKKFRILNSAKIFILPSYEENWAIVIGEAMAIKLPVISYKLKEIVPIWGDNIEWVELGNKKEFAKKIVYYLNYVEARNCLREKAFKFIKRYNWKEIAGKEFD